jgi:hypothetical protein
MQYPVERLSMAALGPCHTDNNDNYSNWIRFRESQTTPAMQHKCKMAGRRRERLAKTILWKALGTHAADNAFHHVDFGANPGSIYAATPTDTMHALDEGLIKYVVTLCFNPMSDGMKTTIDNLVEKVLSVRSGERKGYPRINFTRGYTRLTMLSANENIGVLLALAILLQLPEGKALIADRFDPDFDKRRKQQGARFKGVRQEEEDDYSDDEDADDTSVGEEDNPATVATAPRSAKQPFTGSTAQVGFVREVLDRHDLSFVHSLIQPILPSRHRQMVNKLVWTQTGHLQPATLHSVQLPPGVLDYGPTEASIPVNPSEPSMSYQRNFPESGPRRQLPLTEKAECSISGGMIVFGKLCEQILALEAFCSQGHTSRDIDGVPMLAVAKAGIQDTLANLLK